MTKANLNCDTRMLSLTFDDGESAVFPLLWLKDNDPAGFHPDTKERAFDLTSVPLDLNAKDVQAVNGHVTVEWDDNNAPSQFETAWLRANIPGRPLADPAMIAATTWQGDFDVPRVSAEAIMHDDNALRDWMEITQRYGLSIVEGLEDDTEAGIRAAERIGFLRRTNFGTTFQVKSKPNPNNLAYTADALPLHTDLANQEVAPGFQFLHCLANEAEGGGSTFCDGIHVAETLRAENPAAFELLATTSVPFRFHDDAYDIRARKRVIELREDGSVHEICFNAHLAGVLDIDPEIMGAYYAAYRRFMEITRDPANVAELMLKAGEMVVFDNRRALHGRSAFDPSTGYRHLHGCYVDRGEFESRLRVLAQA